MMFGFELLLAVRFGWTVDRQALGTACLACGSDGDGRHGCRVLRSTKDTRGRRWGGKEKLPSAPVPAAALVIAVTWSVEEHWSSLLIFDKEAKPTSCSSRRSRSLLFLQGNGRRWTDAKAFSSQRHVSAVLLYGALFLHANCLTNLLILIQSVFESLWAYFAGFWTEMQDNWISEIMEQFQIQTGSTFSLAVSPRLPHLQVNLSFPLLEATDVFLCSWITCYSPYGWPSEA
jgi:hypothetical protein